MVGSELPERAGKDGAVGDFRGLPAGTIEAFCFYGLGEAGLTGVHPEKQWVELWRVSFDVLEVFIDGLPESALWWNKAGRFVGVDECV